jgi:hypothetical protein
MQPKIKYLDCFKCKRYLSNVFKVSSAISSVAPEYSGKYLCDDCRIEILVLSTKNN